MVQAIPFIVMAAAKAAEQMTTKKAQAEQRKTEKKQAAIARASAAFQNARQARLAVAEARVKQAQTLAIGEAQGASGSSAVAGAYGAIGSQTAGALGAAQTQQAAQAGIDSWTYKNNQDQAKFASQNAIHQTAFQFAAMWASKGMSIPSSQPTQVGTPPSANKFATPYQNAAGQSQMNFSNYAQAWGNANLLGQRRATDLSGRPIPGPYNPVGLN